MSSYLSGLGVIPFVRKDLINTTNLADNKLVDISENIDVDLLVIVEKPLKSNLQELLAKIMASIQLVNQNTTYYLCHEIRYLQKPELFKQHHNITFKKLLFFENSGNLDRQSWSSSYNLNNTDVLCSDTLEVMSADTSIKKKLWLDLQNFL